MSTFPRTTVGGISVPRLIIGTNWMLGYSHTGHAADRMITERHATKEQFLPTIQSFASAGVDAIMGPISGNDLATEAVLYAQHVLGKKLIIIDTPIINVDDTDEAREEARRTIEKSAEIGATFCLIHHASCEQLLNKNTKTIDRLPDYLKMIRECGLIPGVTAHMPEVIQYCDWNDYDVETYVQIFNCMGFMMQIEIESVIQIIHEAKHPVMTIKPMAAGRTTPYVGLTFNWNVLREQDMITVGCLNAYEAEEDIEISLAALERRLPMLTGRSSPAPNQTIVKQN